MASEDPMEGNLRVSVFDENARLLQSLHVPDTLISECIIVSSAFSSGEGTDFPVVRQILSILQSHFT